MQAAFLTVVADGYEQLVALLGIACQCAGEQVELLVEDRLRFAVGDNTFFVAEVVAVAVFHYLHLQHAVQELVGGATHGLGLGKGACYGMFLVGQTLVIGFAGVVHEGVDALCHLHQALHPHGVALGEVFQQRHFAFHLVFAAVGTEIRHYVDTVELLDAEL